jgi:S1-C subfamily serine protease
VLEIEKYKPGEVVSLSILRDGKPLELAVTLSESN